MLYRAHSVFDAKLSPKDRVVFLYRNPFDAIPSNLKYLDKMKDGALQDGDVKRQTEIFTDFITGLETCSNTSIVVEYEQLLTNFREEIKRVAGFLGFPASDEKVTEFIMRDDANFLRYLEYFSRVDKHHAVTYDRDFFNRRKALSPKQAETIQKAVGDLGEKYSTKHYWKYRL